MRQVLRFEGHIPSKKNSKRIVGKGKFKKVIPSKAHEAWHKQKLPKVQRLVPMGSPLGFTFDIYPGSLTEFDLDNTVTSIMDLFVDAGFIQDDSWVHARYVMPRVKGFCRGDEHTIVTITELPKGPMDDALALLKDRSLIKTLAKEQGVTQRKIIENAEEVLARWEPKY